MTELGSRDLKSTTSAGPRHRPIALNALMIILAFQGLSGVAGGLGLVLDPSGSLLAIPIEWLDGSPFGDYLIPGIVLLVGLGVFPLILVTFMWRGIPWSLDAGAGVGVILLVWLGIEIFVIGYQPVPPFQAVYAAVGISIIVLAYAPSVRAEYNRLRARKPEPASRSSA